MWTSSAKEDQMAISDRNLSVGTKLYAKYKGQIYTCEVVDVEVAREKPPKGEDGTKGAVKTTTVERRYRIADGREFKSPSSAGAAIMGPNRTCNGWSFWTVGEPGTAAAPV